MSHLLIVSMTLFVILSNFCEANSVHGLTSNTAHWSTQDDGFLF